MPTKPPAQGLPPAPALPAFSSATMANPHARHGAELPFKDFVSDFLIVLKRHCKIQSAVESDETAETRTSFRKEGITRAAKDAPPGSQTLKLHETASVKYLAAPATPNLNSKGLAALALINNMRAGAGGTREADWWLTFSPAPRTDAGWKFEYAEVQEKGNEATHARTSEAGTRKRAEDVEWITDVLDATVEHAVLYSIACEFDFGTDTGKKQDKPTAIAWYHRSAALPPGGGRYIDKYENGFSMLLDMYRNGSAARCNLADKYEHGAGTKQDFQKALYWYGESARQDNGVAEYSLGNMFAEGKGVPADADAAIAWFQRAIAHGFGRADVALEKLLKARAKAEPQA